MLKWCGAHLWASPTLAIVLCVVIHHHKTATFISDSTPMPPPFHLLTSSSSGEHNPFIMLLTTIFTFAPTQFQFSCFFIHQQYIIQHLLLSIPLAIRITIMLLSLKFLFLKKVVFCTNHFFYSLISSLFFYYFCLNSLVCLEVAPCLTLSKN